MAAGKTFLAQEILASLEPGAAKVILLLVYMFKFSKSYPARGRVSHESAPGR
jgi:hypothetical protein